MASSSYDESLRRLLVHEGGYTNDAADPGGPTNFGITIFDYRKYVKPDATAADVCAMKVEEAKSIYRAKYWDAQRCDELPAGVDYAVFDYGVNSGIGRAKKVLQRVAGVAADGVLGDDTMKAVATRDAKQTIAAICDERLRFLHSLRTWPVFGKGWGRRVAEVRAVAEAMAASAPMPGGPQDAAQGRAVVPVQKAAQQGTAGAAVAAGTAAAQQAHQSGFSAAAVAAIVVAAVIATIIVWAFWHWRQKNPTGASSMMWEKIKAWFKHSLTILWARVVALAGLLLACGQSLLGDPNVTAAIQAALQPKFIPYYVIAIGLVTEIARRRTAGNV